MAVADMGGWQGVAAAMVKVCNVLCFGVAAADCALMKE